MTLAGISLGRIELIGVALDRIVLGPIGHEVQGIALCLVEIALGRIALEGIFLQGLPVQGIPLEGIALEHIAPEKIVPEGVALEGIALDHVALESVALDVGKHRAEFVPLLFFGIHVVCRAVVASMLPPQ